MCVIHTFISCVESTLQTAATEHIYCIIFSVFYTNNKRTIKKRRLIESLILYCYILIIRLLKLILSTVLPLCLTSHLSLTATLAIIWFIFFLLKYRMRWKMPVNAKFKEYIYIYIFRKFYFRFHALTSSQRWVGWFRYHPASHMRLFHSI